MVLVHRQRSHARLEYCRDITYGPRATLEPPSRRIIRWEHKLCNRDCPMSMPPNCADTDSLGVCTPTVTDICDTLQGSRDSCTSSSDAAQTKADGYLTVDVRASPCDGDEQYSTLNALKAYKVAYNNWGTAFNNASQVCKVGETIRDYNGQSFMALHKNVDQVAKAAAAVCNE